MSTKCVLIDRTAPKGYWRILGNQRKWFDMVRELLHVDSIDDWYRVNTTRVVGHGGRELLKQYGGSLIDALKSIYPEGILLPWRFKQVPNSFWENLHNQRMFLEWLAEYHFDMHNIEDWYRVEPSMLNKTITGTSGDLSMFQEDFGRIK